jgi:UDP-N-acetylmuramoyl-tripeptide--D-alanyl-D-alanine ligase
MSEMLWKADALAAGLGGTFAGPAPAGVTGLSIDTRTLQPGDLFFALAGENRDGHAFVPAAFQAGAAAAVVSQDRAAEFAALGPVVAVDDVLRAMERLGQAARARVDATVVAVTGSVGKTSTKEALRHVFSRAGRTHASVASYNNHWGVPLTLGRMPAATRYGVFEIGMSNPFEIIPLARMVRPDIAIVTTVEPVHLAQFRSVDGIADAKGEIFAGLRPGGTAIINRDNPRYERLRAHALASAAGRIVTFGEHERADVRLLRIALRPAMSSVEAEVMGQAVTYRLGLPGKHMALNSLAVLAAARVAGLDLALAALSLADVAAGAGRGAQLRLRTPGGELTLLDESYNANPASMRAALSLLAQVSVGFRGRRIAVLGDMLELGPTGPDLHRDLKTPIIENEVELVFCAGPMMRNLWQALPPERRGGYAASAAELVDMLLPRLGEGDAVVVKGSLGSRMGPVVKAIQARYPPVTGGDTDA